MQRDKILAFLASAGDEGATKRDIAEGIRVSFSQQGELANELVALKQANLIKREERRQFNGRRVGFYILVVNE